MREIRIAIHSKDSEVGAFDLRWIEYLNKSNIAYKIVDAYSSTIVDDLSDVNVFLWYWKHADYRDKIFAKQLIQALEIKGVKVFPNIQTCWHFDDKIAQKYLLEAINAPLIPSYVFYEPNSAEKWIMERKTFPLVAKLRGGAGALNVHLLENQSSVKKYITKSFGVGFKEYDSINVIKDKFKRWRNRDGRFLDVCKSLVYLFVKPDFEKYCSRENGYVYFQDFVPNCTCDYRIKVIGDVCWGFRRLVRKNDFRASGSGLLVFNHLDIPIEMIKIAFDVSRKLGLQSVAFDFVIYNDEPLIIEMSYAFGFDERELTSGFWDADLNFHAQSFNPFELMISALCD